MGTLKRAPGQMSAMPFFLIWPCWDNQFTFCSLIPYVKFYKVSFGGQNVQAPSVIGIRWDAITCRVSHALSRKEKIGIKVLDRKNVGKVFLT